jgi:hypothetical protein
VERGNLQSLWLTPIGITESHNEPRIPPLTQKSWRAALEEKFSVGTNAVLMTDSASAYREVPHPGIREKHAVNHSEHEYSRSVDVLKDVDTKERRPGMAGTQTLDHEWRLLKGDLPETGFSSVPKIRAQVITFIRGSAPTWSAVVFVALPPKSRYQARTRGIICLAMFTRALLNWGPGNHFKNKNNQGVPARLFVRFQRPGGKHENIYNSKTSG